MMSGPYKTTGCLLRDMGMGENESTAGHHANPASFIAPPLDWVRVDDRREPITAEWWIEKLGPNPIATNCGWLAYYQCGALLNSGRLNVKNRGDLRELCRLLGVELK